MISLSIHPSVLLSISDHYSRAKISSGKITKVLGALVGKFVSNSI